LPSIDVGGVSLYYEEKGAGRPVVFVHGIPTDYRAWSAQVEPFSRAQRAVMLSRRHAAPNPRQGDLADSTVGNNAADLKGFIEKLGMGPVDLVGHSYGGFVAAYLAAVHADLVRSLVLVEPAISTLLVANQKSATQLLALLFKSPSVALAARRFQDKSLVPSLKALEGGNVEKAVELNVDGVQDWPGAYAKMPEETKRMMLDNVKTIAELKTEFPRFTKEEAHKISARTLILNGESSSLWLRKIGELLAGAVPKAEAVRVPRARHFPHMENPEFFNEKVLTFFEERDD
jgi:pimeloyl-ACP methyl ester carboxylesterase